MALTYSWLQFCERVGRHINNNFPNEEFSTSTNEILLYINEAMSYGLVGQVYNGAKVLGTLEVPEAYIVQFELPALIEDTVSGKWTTTLPQPPLSLPLGYSINRVYPGRAGWGQGKDVIFLKAKRVARRLNMPLQYGVYGYVTNSKLWLFASDGSSLLGETFYAEMPSTRAVNLNDAMPLPDDAAKLIMDLVIARLKDRLQLPQDIIKDDLPPSNKAS
jgi:hypothetical protein